MSGSFWSFRAAAELPDYDYEGPDIRVLWDKTPKARKAHRCDACGEEIAAGEVYESRGYTEDGAFKAEKLHRWAYLYPSGCPTRGALDAAEIAAAAEA